MLVVCWVICRVGEVVVFLYVSRCLIYFGEFLERLGKRVWLEEGGEE